MPGEDLCEDVAVEREGQFWGCLASSPQKGSRGDWAAQNSRSVAGLMQVNAASAGRPWTWGRLGSLSLGQVPELLRFHAGDKELASVSPLKHVSAHRHFCIHAPFVWTDGTIPV